MNENDISKFTTGSRRAVNRLNDMISELNKLLRFTGDEFIKLRRTPHGWTVGLNVDKLRERIPNVDGGSSLIRAQVVAQPSYADPTAAASTEEFTGRSWYTCRLVGDSYSDWVGKTVYSAGQQVLYPIAADLGTGEIAILYTATDAHDGINSFPDATPGEIVGSGYWTTSEEIRVEYAMGNEQQIDGADVDIRDHFPWFRVGEIVPLTTRIVDDVSRYYLQMTLIYGGTAENSSLRWDPETNRARAVFK